MRLFKTILFLFILMLSSCRLWRQDADHRSHRSGQNPGPDSPPNSEDKPNGSSGPEDRLRPDPSPPESRQTILLDFELTRDRIDLNAHKNRLSFKAVTSTMAADAFQKKAAPHPRILASSEDFARIRQSLKAQDAYVVKHVEALKKAADAYLKAAPEPYKFDAAKLRLTAPHSTQEAIAVLSLLYQLTGHRDYADKVKEHLLHYARFQDWNDGKHFLDTGIMSYSVALGYDWTFDNLSAEERKIISTALIEKGMRPYLNRASPSAFWYQSKNNWNPICNGGVSLAAMAVMDSSAEAKKLGADVLARALQGAPSYIREFEPDGQTVEGMMYWDYGLSNLIRWMETLKRTLGTDFGYTDTMGLRAAGFFPLAVSGPVTGISLGDDPLKKSRSGTNFWFSKRYDSPSLARYHWNEIKLTQKYAWMDLLFYDPKLLQRSVAPAQELPLDRYVRDLEYVSFRSSWDHAQALYVGIHGGDNMASHGHLDAGTFFVQGGGQVWAIGGLGGDDYTFPGYFSKLTLPDYGSSSQTVQEPGRFHMYRLRAEGKNTLVFNPDVRPDQNPAGKAEVERILTQPSDAMTILNLSAVYDRDAQRVRRGAGLRQQRRVVVIQDEIKMKAPSSVWWSMHTSAQVELQQNGRVAILRQGNKNLWVEIQSPAEAAFAVEAADYLQDLSFPLSRNSPNTFQNAVVRKLTIHRQNVSELTLTVIMQLMTDIRNPPSVPAPVRLDDWAKAFVSP
jgi:hypothetical protein